MILFIVSRDNAHILVWSWDREDAKRRANQWLGFQSDAYTVTPLTAPGDRVKLDITLSI